MQGKANFGLKKGAHWVACVAGAKREGGGGGGRGEGEREKGRDFSVAK